MDLANPISESGVVQVYFDAYKHSPSEAVYWTRQKWIL